MPNIISVPSFAKCGVETERKVKILLFSLANLPYFCFTRNFPDLGDSFPILFI